MNNQDTFLQLDRLGIGHYADHITGEINWNDIQAIAEQQGLSAIIVDAVEKLPDNMRPPKPVLLQWIGETIQGFEFRFEQYKKAIGSLAGFHNQHGYKMMVIKGYACSLDWPKPEHRPCGDIDIWQFGKQKEVDALLAKEKGIKIDKSHHHHTVFYWSDFMVENHYDFINIHHHKSNVELDRVLKELAMDDSYSVELCGEKFYVPSPTFHAFFLMRHTMNHFASSEISMRQLLDWAFFVKAHGKEVDWKRVIAEYERFGMMRLFNVFNAICVEELGFNPTIFPMVQFEPQLKDRVLQEIISPSFAEDEPHWLLKRIVFKYRRWKANSWKHELCYKESMWSAFWSGVWSHLLKPMSI